MTTNTLVGPNTSNTAEVNSELSVEVGNYLVIDEATGFLKVADNSGTPATTKPETGIVWKVVKEYTMPDGISPGIKIQRIQ